MTNQIKLEAGMVCRTRYGEIVTIYDCDPTNLYSFKYYDSHGNFVTITKEGYWRVSDKSGEDIVEIISYPDKGGGGNTVKNTVKNTVSNTQQSKDIYYDEENNQIVAIFRIDVSTIPDWYKYIAINENGKVYAYSEKPQESYYSWDGENGCDLNVSNWKSLILELPEREKELTEEEIDSKLQQKLKSLSKEDKLKLLEE